AFEQLVSVRRRLFEQQQQAGPDEVPRLTAVARGPRQRHLLAASAYHFSCYVINAHIDTTYCEGKRRWLDRKGSGASWRPAVRCARVLQRLQEEARSRVVEGVLLWQRSFRTVGERNDHPTSQMSTSSG